MTIASLKKWKLAVGLLAASLGLAACGSGGAGGGGSGAGLRIGEIMTGPVSDHSWNYRQSVALKLMESKYGAKTTYIETVPVADATQDGRQLVSNGSNAVLFNSPAFFNSALQLAQASPKVEVVGVSAALTIPNQPKNLWLLQAKFAPADYVMGYAAALVAKGPKVCYLGGVELPNIVAGANAALRGAKAARPSIGGGYSFTGDFDDPSKARQATTSMINQGCGAFVLLLDNAVSGVAQAIKASGKTIPWFSYNSDQHNLGPSTYGGGYTFDWNSVYSDVFGQIKAGKTSGSYDLSKGFKMFNLYNMTTADKAKVMKVYKDVVSGKTQVDSSMTSRVVVP